MSSTEDALLAAICADPVDDTARLVFADFLQEHGGKVEEAWARFIRAHTRLVTGTETAGDIPTVRYLGSEYWLKRFAERVGIPPGCGVSLDGWERGFPATLTADYPRIRERWVRLLARVPFRRLAVFGIEDEAIEDLVEWSGLERLTALDLTTWDSIPIPRTLSERGVAALASCSALAGLESLSLSFLDVTDRVAELILNSRYLTGLRNLVLSTSASHLTDVGAWNRLSARFGPNAIQ